MGERAAWLKLARELGMSLQKCQRETTSTEFVDWMVFLEMEEEAKVRQEWLIPAKMDYYLAQIVAEIREFRLGFTKHPQRVETKECLLQFEINIRGVKEVSNTVSETKKELSRLESLPPSQSEVQSKKKVEIGSEEAKTDPHWKAVTAKAKTGWAMLLGPMMKGK